MNFFERQHAARGTTVRLVALFVLAVIAIVAAINLVLWIVLHNEPNSSLYGWMITVSIIALLVITGGTVSKTLSLRAGGAVVAQQVGAVAIDPTTTDPRLRRFVNIVEEMSLASGVPMPRLFVLESEPAINAFAAGYSPADAAITVTQGALTQLNRDELQGVIGHEFSHILNGDMRLNIKLIGLLNGILLIGLIGLRIMQFAPWSGGGRRNDRDNSAGMIVLLGLVMMILGFVGQFFASLIKAAVSRQREWLADASSVQFTRQTTGLAGALKKIAGLESGSALRNKAAAAEVSHMLFGDGGKAFASMFATHPPLMERIKALEPDFDPRELAGIAPAEAAGSGVSSGFTGTSAVPVTPAGAAVRMAPPDVAARVGTLTPEDVETGHELSRQIPDRFRTLAGQPSTAIGLAVAMLLSADAASRDKELELVARHLGAQAAQDAAALAGELAGLPAQLRLPVLGMAAPQITSRPEPELEALLATLDALAKFDGVITLFEYCLTRQVASWVHDSRNPAGRSRPGTKPGTGARAAASTVLAALATVGNSDPAAAQRAYNSALATLTRQPSNAALPALPAWSALDPVWTQLDAVEPTAKQLLVQAMVAAVRDDGVLTLNEAELLRTACGLIHCPLPAFVA